MVQWGEYTNTPMTLSLRLSLATIAAAIVPCAVIAATVVPSVTGIRAEMVQDHVRVSWDAVAGSVANYRIFYSHASILGNDGMYDDYEDAPGNVTEFTLPSIPPAETLYISILAVATDGTESPFFLEEAVLPMSGGTSSSPAISSVSSTSPVAGPSTLRLLAAAPLSSTGVTLSFTLPLTIQPSLGTGAFIIRDASGTLLTVKRYMLEGTKVSIDTATQVPGRTYRVSLEPSVTGVLPMGGSAPQDDDTTPLLFTALASQTTQDVRNMTLALKGRLVEATWALPQGQIRELQVQQSSDGGKTFGTPVRLEKTARGVEIPGVTGSQFTLLVRVVGVDGSLSAGARQTIPLPGMSTSSTSSVSSAASVSSTPTEKPGTLPNSGLGLATVVMLSGGIAGVRFMQKKNALNGSAQA